MDDELRAKLAAAILPGMLQNPDFWGPRSHTDFNATYFARMAVEHADAIIAEVARTSEASFTKTNRNKRASL